MRYFRGNRREAERAESRDRREAWQRRARTAQEEFSSIFEAVHYYRFKKVLPSICRLIRPPLSMCECENSSFMCENGHEMTVLKSKIGYALFGVPPEEGNQDNNFTGYPIKCLKVIDNIFKQVVNHQEGPDIMLSVLYVILEMDGGDANVPVFRIPSATVQSDESIFIDNLGRIYKSWEKFLSDNLLPKSQICYPKDGCYSLNSAGEVDLCFGTTPSSSSGRKILSYADTGANCVGIAAAVGGLLFPAAGAAVIAGMATASGWSFARSSMTLHDLRTHGISLASRQAIGPWLSIMTTIAGAGSSAGKIACVTKGAAGEPVSRILKGSVNAASCASLAGCIGLVANDVCSIVEEGEPMTPLDLFQLSASVLFVMHSVYNFETASSCYKKGQASSLSSIKENLSKNQKKKFSKKLKTAQSYDDKAKIIKNLKHFKSPKDLLLNSSFVSRADVKHSHGTCSMNTLLDQFMNCIQNIQPRDVECLMDILRQMCQRFKFGPIILEIVEIVLDLMNVRNVRDVVNVVMRLFNFLDKLFERDSSAEGPSEDQVYDALNDGGILPSLLSREDDVHDEGESSDISSHCQCHEDWTVKDHQSGQEKVFHFPKDHLQWGDHGELSQEICTLIGRRVLEVENVECRIMPRESTTYVYIQNVGLVSITSYVRESKVVVHKFLKSTCVCKRSCAR